MIAKQYAYATIRTTAQTYYAIPPPTERITDLLQKKKTAFKAVLVFVVDRGFEPLCPA